MYLYCEQSRKLATDWNSANNVRRVTALGFCDTNVYKLLTPSLIVVKYYLINYKDETGTEMYFFMFTFKVCSRRPYQERLIYLILYCTTEQLVAN